MKVAVMADVHGNLPALEAVLAELEREPDLTDWIMIGDIALYGPYPEQCFTRLLNLQFDRDCILLRGNADHVHTTIPARDPQPDDSWKTQAALFLHRMMEPRQLAYMARLHFGHVLMPEMPEQSVLFVHATPRSDDEVLVPETGEEQAREMLTGANAHIVVGGHTHLQFERTVQVSESRSIRFINPGSVGRPYDNNPDAGYAIMSFTPDDGWQVEMRRVPYDIDAVAAESRRTDLPHAEQYITNLRAGRRSGSK